MASSRSKALEILVLIGIGQMVSYLPCKIARIVFRVFVGELHRWKESGTET